MAVMNDFTHDSRVFRETITLSQNHYIVSVIAIQAQGLKNYEIKQGINIIRVPQPHHTNFISLIKYFLPFFKYGSTIQKNIYNELVKIKADVYHAHDLNTLLPCYKAAAIHKAKLVYDSHELFIETIKNPKKIKNVSSLIYSSSVKIYFQYIEKKLIKRVDQVITVNSSISDFLATKYNIKKPAVIMNYPLIPSDIKNYDLRKLLHLPPQSKIILYHGGIGPDRGLLPLVQSFKFLAENYKLVLIGRGSYEMILKQKIQSENLNNRIYLHDMMPLQELFSYIPSANLGVILFENINLNMQYATPNKLFEYLFAGLPVLASNLKEIEKIIREEEVGIIVDTLEPKSIAKKIKDIIESPNYKDIKLNALEVANSKFNWNIEAEKLLEIYKNICPS